MVIPTVQKIISPSNLLEEIYSHFTEEQVMEIYLGRSPSALRFPSIFRANSDSNTCSLSWVKCNGKSTLVYKDWSLGYSWNIIGVAGLKLGIIDPLEDPFISMKGKYNLIVHKMHSELVKGKNLPKLETVVSTPIIKEGSDIKVVLRENWSEEDLEYWELTPKQLSEYHIYPIAYAIVNGIRIMTSSVECPTYGYYFPEYSTSEHQVWKIYKPFCSKLRNCCKWLSNTKHNHIFKTWQ